MFYCFTISSKPVIISKFQALKKDSHINRYFLGSKFSNKNECLNFAHEVEELKFNALELDFTIYAGKNRLYFPFIEFLKAFPHE